MNEEKAYKNTNKEIWRGKSRSEFGDDDRFYADSLFVPEGEVEALGINCGGFVLVKPIREWHRLAKAGETSGEWNVPQLARDIVVDYDLHCEHIDDPDPVWLEGRLVDELKAAYAAGRAAAAPELSAHEVAKVMVEMSEHIKWRDPDADGHFQRVTQSLNTILRSKSASTRIGE